jgi:hypothetical protein
MNRVYFDSNEGDETGRYGLWLGRSREELAKIPGGPKEGMQIIIYMIGEIEMEAILEWSERWKAWVARPIKGTIRDNQETRD